MTTSCTSSASTFASFNARRQVNKERFTNEWINSLNCSRLNSPSNSRQEMTALCSLVKAILVCVAKLKSSRCSLTFCGLIPACSTIQSAIKWSKSSPPKAVSPPVAKTSKTPLDKRKIEISKVPPPKS